MQKLVGRSYELKQLEKLLASDSAELLAVYGRRRVGKTFLIQRFFANQGLYFEVTGINNGKREQQIDVFMKRIELAFGKPKSSEKPKDWFGVFSILEDCIEQIKGNHKIILFFDEFPWMDTRKSDLLKAFEYLWNAYLSKNPRIITVICGSSVSWMVKKIIHNTGGLYGRLTMQMRLKPFTLKEVEEYFIAKQIHLDRKQIVEINMALGGIPKYLNYVEGGLSSAQIIQQLCFTPGAPLVTEFQSLYESLFDNCQLHLDIIELLAHSRIGLTVTQIAENLKQVKGGQITRVLKDLIASNFVQFIPYFGRKMREGRYRVVDEYSLFYLNWIRDNMHNYDEPISPQFWLHQHASTKFKSWAGYTFESICFKHLRQIIKALDLTVVAEKAFYWSCLPTEDQHGAQIDLIIERRDKCMNLCEIKFSDSEYKLTESEAKKICARRTIFRERSKTRKTLFNTLITPFGASKNMHYLSTIDQQLNLDALFLEPGQ